MKVKELLDRLSEVNPEAEISLVDMDFGTQIIDSDESFGVTKSEVTIYICE